LKYFFIFGKVNNKHLGFLRKIFAILVIARFILPVYPQLIAESEDIEYLPVDSVAPAEVAVYLEDTLGLHRFFIEDKVLLIQMTGITIQQGGGWDTLNGDPGSPNGGGKYEFIAIESIDKAAGKIVFTTVNFLNTYSNNEKIQLVKVIESEYAEVGSSGLMARDWDGSTGGIVPLVIYKKLTLKGDIDVSGKGYRGAGPAPDYTGGCQDSDTFYFDSGQPNRAGIKGEGITTVDFDYPYGAGRNLNGGGGGNGEYGGGGGGSNYGLGGQGGIQVCGDGLNARGGFDFNENHFYDNPQSVNSVIMGGGGGSSVENSDSGYTSTKAGDGGGIVFIITDTLEESGGSIIANGEDVTDTVNAGGGGGGGGGSVILDVTNYINTVNIYVQGGNGGSTGDNCTGSGGGGGGGVVVHSGITMAASLISTGGERGYVGSACVIHSGKKGSDGGIVDSLHIVLNGFLFNVITGTDTVCEGLVPNTITGTIPKGGDGTFDYQWQKKGVSGADWTDVGVEDDSLSYNPGSLFETTLFRRYVTASNGQTDTSKIIEIFVYPKIENNGINATDTLCMGDAPGLITGDTVSGGNGTDYNYIWERAFEQPDWSTVATDPDLTEGSLSQTSYYRRIVTSTIYCSDTSEIDTITVLDPIAGNVFSRPDTSICYNLDAGVLKAGKLSGGDGIYSFQWQERTNSSSWYDITGGNDPSYGPGTLTDSMHYRRIVYSGNDNACSSISESKSIYVLPLISNNDITTDSSTYCAGDIPEIIEGLQPGGGDGSYSYLWYRKYGTGSYEEIPDAREMSYVPSREYEDTTVIRRIVISGDFDACVDTSNELFIKVIPYINNNLGLDDQKVCEGIIPRQLDAPQASGGAGPGTYYYQWQVLEEGEEVWELVTGVGNEASYEPDALSATSIFRRRVTSDICGHLSDTVEITVYPSIKNNRIVGGTTQYTCYGTGKSFTATYPRGGDPNGQYRYQWERSTDNIAWDDGLLTDEEEHYITAALTDSTYFRRIVFSGDNDECIDTSMQVKVMINPLPVADIITSVDTVCSGEELMVNYEAEGNGPWEISLGNGTNTSTHIVSDPEGQIGINLTVSGEVILTSVLDDSLCSADLSLSTGVVQVIVYEVPRAEAGNDDKVCGLDYTLNAVPTAGNGLWTAAGGSFDESIDPVATVTMNSYGSHILTWTETNWKCKDSDQVEVVFYEQPVDVYAGEDMVLDYDFSTRLDADPAVVGTGEWSFGKGTGLFEDPGNAKTIVRFSDEENSIMSGKIDYVLIWTITNGVCPAIQDSLRVMINDLDPEMGFSPNGDGINDYFKIDVTGSGRAELTIFNRWGNVVFGPADYTPDNYWDGTNMNGKVLPSDTYYYILKEQNKPDRTGFVELRR